MKLITHGKLNDMICFLFFSLNFVSMQDMVKKHKMEKESQYSLMVKYSCPSM